MRRSLTRLKEAQQDELEEAQRAARWHSRLRTHAERIKGVATLLGALGTMFTMGAALYHRMRGQEVAPPELPATGQPTVSPDFVAPPRTDGGRSKR